VFLSAQTGEGLDKLKALMSQAVQQLNQEVELYFPRELEHRIYELGRETQINKTESATQGTICYASMTPSQLSRWREFIVQDKKRY
jgi:GTP-binding protein HflX